MSSIYDGLFEEYNFLRSIIQDYKDRDKDDNGEYYVEIDGIRYSIKRIKDRMVTLRKVLLEPY